MKNLKKIIPKIKVNKLDHNPLFIKFLNWRGDKYYIDEMLLSVANSFDEDPRSKEIALKRLDNVNDEYLDNLTNFQRVLKNFMLETIESKDISENFLAWLNNCFNYIEEKFEKYVKDEERKIVIKEAEGRWFESIICYNFIMTFNYFKVDIIKKCKICPDFFSHKGKYAVYCSDECKQKGVKK